MSYGATPPGGESLDQMRERLAAKAAADQAQLEQWQQRNAALLEAAQQRKEVEEAEKRHELQKIREEAFDKEHRNHALRQWLAAGGTPQGFEESWPEIKAEFLKKTVAADLEAARRNMGNFYRDL